MPQEAEVSEVGEGIAEALFAKELRRRPSASAPADRGDVVVPDGFWGG